MIEVVQIILLVLALFSIVYMLRLFWLCLESKRKWLSTDGLVIEVGLEMWPSSTKEEATVGYEYMVDGEKYKSYKWSFFNIHSRSRYARTIINRYPKGSKVKVYYDPARPSRAIIDHSFPYKELSVNLLVITAVVITGLWILEQLK